MKKLGSVLENIYGWATFITMLLGFVVGLLYIFSLIIGSESLAVTAGSIMEWGIRLAAIAVVVGIIHTYLKKNHTLSIKTEAKQDYNQSL